MTVLRIDQAWSEFSLRFGYTVRELDGSVTARARQYVLRRAVGEGWDRDRILETMEVLGIAESASKNGCAALSACM